MNKALLRLYLGAGGYGSVYDGYDPVKPTPWEHHPVHLIVFFFYFLERGGVLSAVYS